MGFLVTFLINLDIGISVQNYIGNIRAAYTKDFTSKDITRQQIAVATYLIDKLALRAGNEKVLTGVAVTHLWSPWITYN